MMLKNSANGMLTLTMTALTNLDSDEPAKMPVTFILHGPTLVTVRYADAKPFSVFCHRALRGNGHSYETGEDVMLGLIESVIDRMADVLERLGNEIDVLSHEVFRSKKATSSKKTRDLEAVIEQLGRKGDFLSGVRESLVSVSRLAAYHAAIETPARRPSKEIRQLVKLVQRDASSLGDHAAFLSGKINFLLDATLGLINLEQNQIIKIFTVASVVFLPPTLVASVYGMNFELMPELQWHLGYPWAVGLMVLVAGGWYASQRGAAPEGEANPNGKGKSASGRPGGPGGRGDRPTPVSLATVGTADIRVQVPAIGSVVPRNQVVVRTRVDGPLLEVAFTEGQAVAAGAVLARIDPEPFKAALAQAQGQLARDAALLKNAQLDLERYQGLLAQDSIAKQQVDTQAALVRQYQGTVQADEAAVKSAALQLSYTTIRAPIAGRAGLRAVDPGNIVKASDAAGLVTIAQLSPITAVFAVPEDRLPAILQRLRARQPLAVEAWDRDLKTRLAEGRLLAVDSLIDSATGTVKLKAEYANRDGSLFPNQFVNVRLLLDTLRGVVAVPTAAVQQGAKGSYVYKLGADGTVAAVPVKLGPADGPLAAVEEGLAAGDRVVVDGLDKLKDGAKVEAIDPKAVDAPGRESKRGGGGRPGH